MIHNGTLTARRTSLWNRTRVQLGGGVLVAVVLPYLVRETLQRPQGDLTSLVNSFWGTLLAVTVGFYGYRRVSRFPGVRGSYHIIPSLAGAFAVMLAGFLFLRLDYSRLHFVASYGLATTWFFAVHFILLRQQRTQIGVVPFGHFANLMAIDHIDWIVLRDPQIMPQGLDGIVADLREDLPDAWERRLTDAALSGMLVMHVKQLEESLTGRVAIEHLSENNLGSLLPGVIYAKIKRIVDCASAVAVLMVLLPLLPFLAAAIKLDSPGPVFFRQQRMGYRGQPFRIVKFRTMRHQPAWAGDARTAAMTQADDDRITRLGRSLRRSRIDELPQILNIIRGEMSWIGPRPEATALSEWYERELPFYRYRHIVRPGITGWAQIRQGHVAEVDQVLGKLHYDFYYIRNFSFWLDVLIVAGTIRTMLNGFGAK